MSTTGEKVRATNAKPLIRLMAQAAKHPNTHTAGHAFDALYMLCTAKASDVLSDAVAVQCVVGYLRHPEFSIRMQALRAIFS